MQEQNSSAQPVWGEGGEGDPQKAPMTLLWTFTTLSSDRSYADKGICQSPVCTKYRDTLGECQEGFLKISLIVLGLPL